MKIVYSPEHRLQHGRAELTDGRLVPVFEHPGRLDAILEALQRRGFAEPVLPEDRGLAPITAVHAPAYVAFLQCAWDEWVAAHGPDGDALPLSWRAPGMREDREPEGIDGRLGYWSFDAGTPITAGTWAAASAAARAADTARLHVSAGARAAFALARPPGHHAGSRFYGGYCFLNGAAIAAQGFRDAGVARVAVLDVDYHHGNGTQQIFTGRADVFTVSLHADPGFSFPFFLGHADETEGGTHMWVRYSAALRTGCPRGAGVGGRNRSQRSGRRPRRVRRVTEPPRRRPTLKRRASSSANTPSPFMRTPKRGSLSRRRASGAPGS
jgi:acetoin utilization deacetylase AcuC-like enzyme